MRWFPAVLFPAVLIILTPSAVFADRPAQAQAHVTAILTDGRHISGYVDAQTDAHSLWIDSRQPGLVLKSSHNWSTIAQITLNKAIYTGGQMPTEAIKVRSTWHTELEINPRRTRQPARLPPGISTRRSQIRVVDVDAVSANWDRNADDDGLRISITPRDANLNIVAANAVVEVELVGERFSPTQSGRRQFVRLGKWTKTVTASQFTASGVHIEVPYQHRMPDSRSNHSDILSDGTVHVRFKVSGVGAFDGTDPWVRLRRYSRLQDRYRLHTGRESTSFGQQPARTPQFRPLQKY